MENVKSEYFSGYDIACAALVLSLIIGTAFIISAMLIPVVSAEEMVENGGFETGDFTGWTAVNSSVSSDYAHTGTYGAVLDSGNDPHTISQDIDLTNCPYITFWHQYGVGILYIDTDENTINNDPGSYTEYNISLNYTGIKTIKFSTSGSIFDDISILCEGEEPTPTPTPTSTPTSAYYPPPFDITDKGGTAAITGIYTGFNNTTTGYTDYTFTGSIDTSNIVVYVEGIDWIVELSIVTTVFSVLTFCYMILGRNLRRFKK